MKISETKMLHLPIVIEQDEDDFFIVSCPVFKGCHSYGSTIDEALTNIEEVIEMCISEEKEKRQGETSSDKDNRMSNSRDAGNRNNKYNNQSDISSSEKKDRGSP